MMMVLHMIPDADGPHQIVAKFAGAMPAGSYLALSDPPSYILPEGVAQVQLRLNEYLGPGASMKARSHDEVARFFDHRLAGACAGSPVAATRPHGPERTGL